MAVNKVVYDGNTLIDLTDDTVTPDTLVKGMTAHDATGNPITGTYDGVTKTELANELNTLQQTIPTKTSDITNDSGFVNETFVNQKVADLVNSAPETLDTLGEVAQALQENENVVDALNKAIGNKVDKVDGKGLSTNDYTTEEKEKLANANTHITDTNNPHDVTAAQVGALPLAGGTMTGTLYGNSGISLTSNSSSANNDQGVTLNNSGHTARMSIGSSGGFGIYSDSNIFIRPFYSEGTGYGIKITKTDISPTTNNSLSLGTSSSMQYNNIYGKTLYQNGKQVANKEDIPTDIVPITVTSTDGVAYAATTPFVKATSLDELKGAKLIIIPNMTSTNAYNVTLNVNGLGAQLIKRWDNTDTSEFWSFTKPGWFKEGYPITVTFNGKYWIIEGMNKPYASDLSGTVAIANGGTGATTAEEARTNLGLKTETWTFTLESGETVTKAVYVK